MSVTDVFLSDEDADEYSESAPGVLWSFNLHVDFERWTNFEVVTHALDNDSRAPELVEGAETAAVVLTGTAEMLHHGIERKPRSKAGAPVERNIWKGSERINERPPRGGL